LPHGPPTSFAFLPVVGRNAIKPPGAVELGGLVLKLRSNRDRG
jgi:hypothetical protein